MIISVAVNCYVGLSNSTRPAQHNWNLVPDIVHTFGHPETLDGGGSTHKLLQRRLGAVVDDTNFGRRGLAGSFGYEKEDAQQSHSIAKQRLLSASTKHARGDCGQ
jgi:hypothetical protein